MEGTAVGGVVVVPAAEAWAIAFVSMIKFVTPLPLSRGRRGDSTWD